MPRPSRFRRVAKWCGVGVCLLLLVAWGVSLWQDFGFIRRNSGAEFVVHKGVLSFRHSESWPPSPWEGWFLESVFVDSKTWSLFPVFFSGGVNGFSLPLWIPFILTAMPTAWLFWRDRKPPPGHCQRCGYNLRALTLPRCPECATEFDPSTVPEE